MTDHTRTPSTPAGPVRYAVVGAGWISQAALMPGVAQTGNSVIAAVVTGDEDKATALGKRYGFTRAYHYDAYAAMIAEGGIDAIYLALPNDQHHRFAIPALEAGIHVLLEKPMATSEDDCRAMIAAADASGAKLMIAYRLHFEPATLDTLQRARAGEIGEPRMFDSTFGQHVAASNHRAHHGYWAGPVTDMGTYPINAARMLFGSEPVRVSAMGIRDPRLGWTFHDTVAVTMEFPDARLAQFTVSYATDPVNTYRLSGSKGDIEMSHGFGFPGPIEQRVTVGGTQTVHGFGPHDQFAAELSYFSDCILGGHDPEPDGEEGLMDVRVLVAIERALATGLPQTLPPVQRRRHAQPSQVRTFPPITVPPLVNAAEPGEG